MPEATLEICSRLVIATVGLVGAVAGITVAGMRQHLQVMPLVPRPAG